MTLVLGTAQDEREVEAFASLADEVFFGGRPAFIKRYSPAFSKGNKENLAVAKEGSRVVAGVASYSARLKLAPTLSLDTLAVGAVCTASDFRGAGISTRLLEQVRSRAIENGIHLLLISGTGPLYQRMGGREVGTLYELHANLNEVNLNAETYQRHQLPSAEIVDACWKAQSLEPVRFERSRTEFEILLTGHLTPFENETVALLTSPDLNGYALVRTGMEGSERVGFMVEHAGDADLWLAIALEEARAQHCHRFFTRLTERPSNWPGRVMPITMTGMLAFADAEGAIGEIAAHLNKSSGQENWSLQMQDGQLSLVEGRTVLANEQADLLQYFWGSPEKAPTQWQIPSFRPDGLNFL